MGTTIERQLYEVTAGLLTGGGVGLLYELFVPLFRGRSKGLHVFLDLVFAFLTVAWIFYAGQVSGEGTGLMFLFLCASGWAFCRGMFRKLARHSSGS